MNNSNKKYALMTFLGAYIVEAKNKKQAFEKLQSQNPMLNISIKQVYKY
jgi:hypothetical protein